MLTTVLGIGWNWNLCPPFFLEITLMAHKERDFTKHIGQASDMGFL